MYVASIDGSDQSFFSTLACVRLRIRRTRCRKLLRCGRMPARREQLPWMPARREQYENQRPALLSVATSPGLRWSTEVSPSSRRASLSSNPIADSVQRRASQSMHQPLVPSLQRRASMSPKRDTPEAGTDAFHVVPSQVFDCTREIYEVSTGTRRVVGYNESVFQQRGWRHSPGNPFFHNSFLWIQLAIMYLISLALASAVYFSFGNPPEAASSNVSNASNASTGGGDQQQHGIEHVWSKYLDSTAGNVAAFSKLGSPLVMLVSLSLSFMVFMAEKFYWEVATKHTFGVTSTVSELCLRAAVMFPSTSPDNMEAKETLLRYGCLAVALLFWDAREQLLWAQGDRERLGISDLGSFLGTTLATPAEVRLLENSSLRGGRSQVAWVWLASVVTKWGVEGRLPFPVADQERAIALCEKGRSHVSSILTILASQLPITYTHITTCVCKLLMLCVALEGGFVVGVSLHSGHYERVVFQMCLIAFTTLYQQALLQITARVWNPFGMDEVHLALSLIQSRLRKECRVMFEAGVTPPYTVSAFGSPGRTAVRRMPAQHIEVQYRPSRRLDRMTEVIGWFKDGLISEDEFQRLKDEAMPQ